MVGLYFTHHVRDGIHRLGSGIRRHFFSTTVAPERNGLVLHGLGLGRESSLRVRNTNTAMNEPDRNTPDYDLARLVETQKVFFGSGATSSVNFRREKLRELESAIVRQGDALLAALAADLGKPALEAYLAEVHFVLSELRLFIRKLPKWTRPKRVGNPFYFLPARSEIRSEPFGVALIAAPWNYPFQLSLSPLIAAVGAGNCVVLKPSELAPATAMLMEKIITDVFNPAHVSVATGGADTGEALLNLPFDYWFYTGSERIGRFYAQAGARTLTPVTLELGGKCPCIIDETADLGLTVERIVAAKFFNAGQTCIAPDFVLVPESMHGAFIQKATECLATSYSTGDWRDLAAIINDFHYQRLRNLITEDAICIGRDEPSSRHLAPRLLPAANWDIQAMKEEIFGPILPVIGYHSLDKALERLSHLPDPLALYVFSRSGKNQERIAASLRSGSICFNDALKQATNLNLPFGGVGPSGMGRYRGLSGFETFTNKRSVTRRYFLRDAFRTAPPYGDKVKRLKKLLR